MTQAEKEEFFDSLADMLESGNTKFGLVEANEGDETSMFKYPFVHSYLGQGEEDPRIEFSNVVTWLNEGEISLEGNLYVLRRGEGLDWLTVEYDGTGGGGGGVQTQIRNGHLFFNDPNVPDIMTDDGSDVDSEMNAIEHNWKPAGPARKYLFNWFHNNNDFADNLPYNYSDWVGEKGTQCYCWWINRGIAGNTVIPAGTPIYSNSKLMYDMYATKFTIICNGHTYVIKPWGYDSNEVHIEREYDGADPGALYIYNGGTETWGDLTLTHLPNDDNKLQITSAYDMQFFDSNNGFSIGATMSASFNPGWFVLDRTGNDDCTYWV